MHILKQNNPTPPKSLKNSWVVFYSLIRFSNLRSEVGVLRQIVIIS